MTTPTRAALADEIEVFSEWTGKKDSELRASVELTLDEMRLVISALREDAGAVPEELRRLSKTIPYQGQWTASHIAVDGMDIHIGDDITIAADVEPNTARLIVAAVNFVRDLLAREAAAPPPPASEGEGPVEQSASQAGSAATASKEAQEPAPPPPASEEDLDPDDLCRLLDEMPPPNEKLRALFAEYLARKQPAPPPPDVNRDGEAKSPEPDYDSEKFRATAGRLLKATVEQWRKQDDPPKGATAQPDGNRELVEALRPFADYANEIEKCAAKSGVPVAGWSMRCLWEDLVRARDALARAEAAMGQAWRPMSEAPRDGTEILAGLHVYHEGVVMYAQCHVIWADDETGEVDPEAYQGWNWGNYEWWRPIEPLPPPPAQEGGER
jgi:hypothetical protein